MINGVANESKNAQEIELVDGKMSRRRRNEASVIRAAIRKHLAALGLANSQEKISNMEKYGKGSYTLILHYLVFLDRDLERKTGKDVGAGKNEESEKRKAVLLGKHFNVLPLCNIKSRVVTIDSRILYGIMKEICPEFDVRKTEFTGTKQETYLEEYLRFQTSQKGQAKCTHGDDRTRWSSHICTQSALGDRSYWSVFDIAHDEA